jgi:hypothetical protein
MNAPDVLEKIGSFEILEIAVFEIDIPDGRAFVAPQIEAVPAFFGGDIAHVHIADDRSKTISVSFLIEKIDTEDRVANLTHLDVSQTDVLDRASSHRIGLDAQHAVEIGTVHQAILGEDVPADSG